MDTPSKLKIRVLLLLGAAIRFILAPLTEQRWDMYIWRLHQVLVYVYNINPFWPQYRGVPSVFCWSYPPLWLLTLILIHPIYTLLSPTRYPADPALLWITWKEKGNMFESYWSFTPPRVDVNLPLLDLIIKTPIILADLLIAVTLYKMIKSYFKDKEEAAYAYSAWLFNPYIIFISSIWGIFDAIPALFTLLSFRELLEKNYKKSAILLSIAILFKLYPIVLIPVFALIIYRLDRRFVETLKFCTVSLTLFLVVTFSSYFLSAMLSGQEPLSLSIKLMSFLLIKRASPDWYGQNIVSGLTPLIILDPILRELNARNMNIPISPLLLATSLTLILIKLYSTTDFSEEKATAYITATFFVIYMTYTVVNPQYFLWALPFILLLSMEKRSSSLRYLYWIISGLGLFSILWEYDLSYHVSPYFLPESVGYLKIFLKNLYEHQPGLLFTALAIFILYISAVKLMFKRS